MHENKKTMSLYFLVPTFVPNVHWSPATAALVSPSMGLNAAAQRLLYFLAKLVTLRKVLLSLANTSLFCLLGPEWEAQFRSRIYVEIYWANRRATCRDPGRVPLLISFRAY